MTDKLTEVYQAFIDGWQLPHSGRIYEWGSEEVNIQGNYSITGPFSVKNSPHLRKIFDAYQNPYTREVCVLAPPRSAKTMTFEVSLLHTIAVGASKDILWLQITDDKAEEMVESRMQPLVLNCKPTKELLVEDRYSLRKNKLKFRHCSVHVSGPKDSVLNGTGYKYVFVDEPWLLKSNKVPLALEQRGKDFLGQNKISWFSQGGTKDSAWHKKYRSGRQWEWGWHCPHEKCNRLQAYVWQGKNEDGSKFGIVWDDNKNTRDEYKRWVIKECAKTAKLKCRHCGYEVTDNPDNRRYLLQRGEWIDVTSNQDFDPHIECFRFTDLIKVELTWGELVTKFLGACRDYDELGDTSTLQSFTQTYLADFWDETPNRKAAKLVETEYNLESPFGPEEKFRGLQIDVQQSEPNFYYTAFSIGKSGTFRCLEYGTATTWQTVHRIRERLGIDYRCVIVDGGDGTKINEIYRECALQGRDYNFETSDVPVWGSYMVAMGDKNKKGWFNKDLQRWAKFKELVAEYPFSDEENKHKCVYRITWSNWLIKQITEALRDNKYGKRLEFNTVTDELTTHLNSEIQTQVKGEWLYSQIAGKPNHWWDCCNMAVLQALMFGVIDGGSTVDASETKPEARN